MFFGIYRFEGKVDELTPKYEKMVASIPKESMHLHVCVRDAGGLTIYDTCPSREVFQSFSSSDFFHEALKSVGLPTPQVTPVGDVQAAILAGKRVM